MTRLKKPITSSERPEARSQADSVSKTRRKGRPAENPSASMTSVRRSTNTASADTVFRVGGTNSVSVIMWRGSARPIVGETGTAEAGGPLPCLRWVQNLPQFRKDQLTPEQQPIP